jgi:flagellar hook-associated protein 1 FlgK
MGTLTGLMALTNAALDADQSAINITANNVANQSTPGYTRETVNFESGDAVSLSGYKGLDGSVSATAVSVRSRVLEQQLQQQTQSSTASTAVLTALQNIQSMFGLTSTSTDASSTTLGSAMNSFFSSLTALASNPTDAVTQTAVHTAASSLTSAFNSTSQGLSNEVTSLNTQIATAARQVNGLTATVAQLNQQITSLSPDQDAGTLEDARQQAILQLSSILGVDQITTQNNGVTLTASDGAVLVSGNQSYSLSTTTVGGNTAIVAGDPPTALTNDIQGGSIGGMLQARDQAIPPMQSAIDQLAYAIGTAVNTQNEAGTTATGTAGTAIFTLPTTATGAAATINVALTSGTGIATAGAGEGPSGTTNALALANLGTANIVSGQTASNNFASFIGSIGTAVSSATTQNTANSASLAQAQTQRDSLSAVSLDDEATSLTNYQRSYEAAAKVFDIVDQMMADALNLGQQTPVS